MVEAQRADIKVVTVQKYKQEFNNLADATEGACNHPLVVECPGGHDSDEGTSYPGSRMCALCCFEEEGMFASSVIPMLGTNWSILATNPERIRCWKDSRKLEKILRQDNRWSIPTERIIEFFLDSKMLTVQEGQPLKHLKPEDLFKKK